MRSSLFMSHSISARLPARQELLQVLGVVLFAVFGWSIRGFLYKLPAFSLYFGIGSNLAVLCYMLAFALVESLLVTGFLVLLSIVLPARWLRDGFVYKCFIIILVLTVAMILFEGYYKADFFKDISAGNNSSIPPILWGALIAAAALAGLFWLFDAVPRLQKYAAFVTEQLSLFTYIYVPLGLIGLVVVLIRNFP